MNEIAMRRDADLALTVYLEPLIERARVLVIGQLDPLSEERLTSLCASVDQLDPSAGAQERGYVPELPFEEGAFDLVVALELSQLPEPHEDAIYELCRVLARGGVLAVCSGASEPRRRRRAPAPQQQLESLLAAELPHVRLFNQVPVRGQAVEELTETAGEIAVDSSLVTAPVQPQRILALASDAPIRCESRLWVELPSTAAVSEPVPDADELARLNAALSAAEHQAAEASRREAEAVRELEAERRARAEAERFVERAHRLEDRLEAAEADFDDAVGRVRWLEGEVADREAHAAQEHKRRLEAERHVAEAKAEVALAQTRVEAAKQEGRAVHAEIEALAKECGELEKRLVERGEHIQSLEADVKHKETAAKDLLEELRRIEQHRVAQIEHDARVAELEVERDRAVERALEAEVARESAQMHVDELRAQLHARPLTAASLDPALSGTALGLKRRVRELELDLELARNDPHRRAREGAERGERTGLNLRVEEAEAAVRALKDSARAPQEPARLTQLAAELSNMRAEYEERIAGLEDRLQDAEPRVHDAEQRLRDAEQRAHDTAQRLRDAEQRVHDTEQRLRDAEQQVSDAERRASGLERELEEADRAAEAHSEDADRMDALEQEASRARARLDELDDELRATQDELTQVRSDAEHARVEASTSVELAQRKEAEARAERDEARKALEDARAILAQLQAAGVHPIDA